MSTRPLGAQPFLPADPGSWSGIIEALQRRATVPGRRRAEPPNGLMISPPPRTSLNIVGIDPTATAAGAGPIQVAGAAREGAFGLELESDTVLRGISKMVIRTWDLGTLTLTHEEHPEKDPAAAVPEPIWIDELAEGDLPEHASISPDKAYAAVPVLEPPRYRGVAIIRQSDRALLRYIRFVRCAVWSPDGARLVIGGEWGLLALDHAVG